MTYTVVWQHQARRLRRLDRRPRPSEARQLGGWPVLYELQDETITVLVLKVGRVP
ncbi:type II toxin-antitoxin system RelE/ParE family toxin [Streptomyces shenzhenensis]|uniref:type II toxin-antitoxin system RelE family toxin n=1 Tax=Streptomyces shenzhenensis TaxID=943815 RepID=UPI0038105EA3